MELVIQQPKTAHTVAFTVKVDTNIKDFKKGDILCCYVGEFPNFEDKEAAPLIPEYWFLKEVGNESMAKFLSLIDKHYKVVEIC